MVYDIADLDSHLRPYLSAVEQLGKVRSGDGDDSSDGVDDGDGSDSGSSSSSSSSGFSDASSGSCS